MFPAEAPARRPDALTPHVAFVLDISRILFLTDFPMMNYQC